MVRNMREKTESQKKTKEQAEALVWPEAMLSELFLNSLRKLPRGTQVKRDGLAIILWKGGAPQAGLPSGIQATPSSMSGLQGTTLEERLPPEA